MLVIEGDKAGVSAAVAKLRDFILRLENTRTVELEMAPRYRSAMFKQHAAELKSLLAGFPSVSVSIPSSTANGNMIKLTGPKDDVEALGQRFGDLIRDIVERNYTVKVPLPLKLRGLVIGKDGATIKKLSTETNCHVCTQRAVDGCARAALAEADAGAPVGSAQINVPVGSADEELIEIVGRKDDVHRARDAILKLLDEQVRWERTRLCGRTGRVADGDETPAGVPRASPQPECILGERLLRWQAGAHADAGV